MPRSFQAVVFLPTLALLAAVAGCSGDDVASGDAGPAVMDGSSGDGGRRDAGIRRDAGPPCLVALPVDILWVIDNSNSMAEEQANLTANFGVLTETLTNPPDDDRDGMPDFPAVNDIRMGVVSTDLGVAPVTGVIGCDDPDGDDGIMVSTSRATDPACAGRTIGPPPWLSYMAPGDPAAFSADFACIGRLGTSGCGLERQLEAALRALTDKAAAGQPNAGFIRPDSLIVVIWVTDEEDCSASDTSIYDPSPAAATRLGSYGTRCANHPELLHPVSRYIMGLRNLVFERPGGIVVAAITGVPSELTANPLTIDYDALLADMRMQYTPDPMVAGDLTPACRLGGAGKAIPARRIVEVVKDFATTGQGLVQSICQVDFRPSLVAIGRLIGGRLCAPPI